MEPETKEKIRLTAREILLTFCDGMAKFEEIVGYPWQRKEVREYWEWRDLDKDRFYHSLRRLEKQGYIKRYLKGKKNLIHLTTLGDKKAHQYLCKNLKIEIPKSWDQKWRLVIFDVPEKKKILRDIIRQRLKNWGFYQLQKSVFVYPFDCQKEISALKFLYNLGPYLQYIVAESIEAEIDLVDHFYEKNTLDKKMLTKTMNKANN